MSNASPSLRQSRVFSEELKRKVIKDLSEGLCTVSEIQRLYQVSRAAVYKWIHTYTPGLVPGTRQVVQMESEAEKTKRLAARVAELERIVGQKQLMIDMLEKVLELGSSAHGYDLKKSFSETLSSGSAPSGGADTR